jgi:hypothetical protein
MDVAALKQQQGKQIYLVGGLAPRQVSSMRVWSTNCD